RNELDPTRAIMRASCRTRGISGCRAMLTKTHADETRIYHERHDLAVPPNSATEAIERGATPAAEQVADKYLRMCIPGGFSERGIKWLRSGCAPFMSRRRRGAAEVVIAKGAARPRFAQLAHHAHAFGAHTLVPAVTATGGDNLVPGGNELADKSIAGEELAPVNRAGIGAARRGR